MSYLLKFLQKYHFLVLFVLLQVLSLVLLIRFNNYQASVFLTSANRMAGQVHEWTANVTGYFGLRKANQEITLSNARLEAENARLRAALTSLTTDSVYIGRWTPALGSDFTLIPARVVNNSVTRADNFITINKGSSQGIREEMGVLSGTGVVGIVYLTGQNYSIVLPILNSKSSISCKIARTEYFGSLNWDGVSARFAYIKDLPRHAEFSLGDTIITSGHSTVFPEGVPIGTVDDMADSKDGQSYILKVKLMADFARLKEVVVVGRSGIQELKVLEDSVRIMTGG